MTFQFDCEGKLVILFGKDLPNFDGYSVPGCDANYVEVVVEKEALGPGRHFFHLFKCAENFHVGNY